MYHPTSHAAKLLNPNISLQNTNQTSAISPIPALPDMERRRVYAQLTLLVELINFPQSFFKRNTAIGSMEIEYSGFIGREFGEGFREGFAKTRGRMIARIDRIDSAFASGKRQRRSRERY